MLHMAKPKKGEGRARHRGDTVFLGAEISPELNAAIEAYAKREDRKKRAVVRRALEEFLKKSGDWPRKPEAP